MDALIREVLIALVIPILAAYSILWVVLILPIEVVFGWRGHPIPRSGFAIAYACGAVITLWGLAISEWQITDSPGMWSTFLVLVGIAITKGTSMVRVIRVLLGKPVPVL